MSHQAAKVLFLTGASTGIGAATARAAVAAGWRVALAARSADKLDALVTEFGGLKRAVAVACDVTDWDQQRHAVERCANHFGRMDAAFANAGGSWGGPFVGGDDTPEEWRKMVDTNVWGVAATARLCLPHLIASQGQLLLCGSVAGRVATGSLYSATKWAVTGMAESIRRQVTAKGVRVTLIGPGRVATPFWDEMPTENTLLDTDIANSVIWALSQPPRVDINEILVRPTGQQI